MASLFDTRRYLTDFDSTRTGHVLTDTLVIGSGVAGARAAIEGALWVAVAGVQLRGALDAAPETPYGAMPGLFLRIAHRL